MQTLPDSSDTFCMEAGCWMFDQWYNAYSDGVYSLTAKKFHIAWMSYLNGYLRRQALKHRMKQSDNIVTKQDSC